ncbi:SDR family NAD(P)-dependent oxidoreductase [Occultella aeris]|uniref:Ketoacyl reductase n=1 Tax=Occultella aeris TaxID=2761496 RepID=A0A7M4DDC1_9MICO|nr:SDR family NAD(P)-dependent oxidoreductase [Occultella aeris]VZO34840.1 Putative ketoacyl reductase [Occultella aeris]
MTTALVTGATRGLGLATSRALARTGARVLIAGRARTVTEQVVDGLRQEGLDAHAVQLDVTSPDSIQAAVKQVERRHGHIDVLVNNAGILPEATDATEHQFGDPYLFRTTFETNLFGAVAVTEAFLPLLRRSTAGRIVNVSSTMGSLHDQENPDSAYYQTVVPAYQSSKAALNSVTISLAKTLADTHIKVTSVCPGFVQTDLTPFSREVAPTTAEQAARVVVTAATLPADAKSGTFIDSDGLVAW